MDKELLRIVIILIGVLVMIGMLLWHFFKNLRQRREPDDYEDADYGHRTEEFDRDEIEDEDEFDRFHLDAVVDGDALLDDETIHPKNKTVLTSGESSQNAKQNVRHIELPKLIEFSLVASADQGFNGEQLFDAFERVGLKYGSVKVFERVDKHRLVDYAVASMIEPGTFPDMDLENYFTPGIVFFMQPREVEHPLAVFDDFIETIDILADELDGVVWDNQKQPLTAETISQFRQLLAQK